MQGMAGKQSKSKRIKTRFGKLTPKRKKKTFYSQPFSFGSGVPSGRAAAQDTMTDMVGRGAM